MTRLDRAPAPSSLAPPVLSLLSLWASTLALTSCTALPWGQGGAEPAYAQRAALIRVVGPDEMRAASDRLGALVEARLGGILPLAPTTLPSGELSIRWEPLGLSIGRPSLDLAPPDASPDEPGLRLHVPVEPSVGSLALLPAGGEALCVVPFEVSAARLTLRLSLAADKLGRIQGVMLPGVELLAADDARATVIKADFAQCPVGLEVEAHTLTRLLAEAIARAATDAVAGELAPALGLDLAFGWSAAVASDALGSGYVRATLRAATDTPGAAMPDFLDRTRAGLAVRFALSVAVDPHPCMGILALADPGPSTPPLLPEAGTVLRMSALERIIGAAWLAGSACADHAGIAEVSRDELALRWPALERLDGGVTVELWPESVPTLRADPDLSDAVVVDFGRVAVDLIGTSGGARWRAGTVVVDLRIHGFVTVGPDGVVGFVPSDIDAVPAGVEAGLLGAPPIPVAEELAATLVEALLDGPLSERLGVLPGPLAPPTSRVWAARDGTLVLGSAP